MAAKSQTRKAEAIEIEFGETHLTLSCEPDAFANFCLFVRKELSDFPEIPVESMESIEIIDTAKVVARRDSPRMYLATTGCVVAVFAIGLPWVIGVGAIAIRIARWFSN